MSELTGTNLVNGGDKKKRRELDFYPTPPLVTHAIMQFLNLDKCLIYEPACGDGDMAEVIKLYGHDLICSDLRETGYGQGGVDFLQTDGDYDAIITNPPFDVSEEFIRHAVPEARVVAMLLKSQYWHAMKREKLFRELPPAFVLPLTWRPDFLFKQREIGDKIGPTMEVGWTVWIEGVKDTRYVPLVKPVLT
jgi:hypothetical protein